MNAHVRDELNALVPGADVTYASYTPTLTCYANPGAPTDPTLGAGSTQTGAYLQIGKHVNVTGFIQFGASGTNAGSGGYQITLPVNAAVARICGHGYAYDQSSGTMEPFTAIVNDATHFLIRYRGASDLRFTQANPWAWAASDFMEFNLAYQAA